MATETETTIAKLGRITLPILFALAVLQPSPGVDADTTVGCLTTRGGILTANIGSAAVSGQLIATVQKGGWYTRPTIRITRLGEMGPVEVGQWRASWYVSDIHLASSTAIVAADGGLVSLGLSAPEAPAELDFIDLMDAQHLAVDGGYAYVVTTGSGGNGWFDVIDATDPASLEQRGELYWEGPDPAKYAIAADNGLVAIADAEGVLIIDVSDPWNPVETGRWPANEASGVALVGGFAVVTLAEWANPGELGITILDLSEPEGPVAVGSWPSPSTVTSVAAYGNEALIGTENDGVFLLDLKDPARPFATDQWNELGFSSDGLAAAWPTIAVSSRDFGLTIIGLDRSCIPPRHSSGRLGPN